MDARTQRRQRREALAHRDALRTAQGRNVPRLQRWRRCRRRIGGWLLELLAPAIVRLLALTWRVQRTGERGRELLASDRPWIVAMWHGRMLCLMPMHLHANRGIHVLVSPSDDGSLALRALRSFGFRAIRGSLHRGGTEALRTMHQLMSNGGQLVVTPDGPRGPRHTMNVGPAWLARAAAVPILPVGVAVDRAWRLRSWDRFTIPKPFARMVVSYGDPVTLTTDAGDAELEHVSAQLRQCIVQQETRGFAQLGIACDHDG